MGKKDPDVKIAKHQLTDQSELDVLEEKLKMGRILFVKTKEFFARHEDNIVLLKDSFNRLRETCEKLGGSMARVDEDILVLSPFKNVQFY